MIDQLQVWHEGKMLHCHLQHSQFVMHTQCAHCDSISTVLHVAYAMSVTKQHALLQDLSAVERFFTVAKRIALFLARTSSQQTIDHLVYEISQQISEDGELAPAALSADTGVRCHSRIEYLPFKQLSQQSKCPVSKPCSLQDQQAWAAGTFSTQQFIPATV